MRSGDDSHRGVYKKFTVTRADGSSEPGKKHDGCRYFVLDLDHDEFAGAALDAYAAACEAKFPELAIDLRARDWSGVHDCRYDRDPKLGGARCLECGEPYKDPR